MPWNEPGSNKKDPWTNRPGSNPGPPDLDELLRKLSARFGGLFGGGARNSGGTRSGGGSFGFTLILIVLVLGWLASGLYIVTEGQRGVVLRFGQFVDVKDAGLRWHMPYPVESRIIVDIGQVRDVQSKTNMLTQDENIVQMKIAAQYRIKDPADYTFNVRNPDAVDNESLSTVFRVMESSLREVVGSNKMDFILGGGQATIASNTKDLMQGVLDEYGAGLEITSFNLQEVQAPEAVQGAFSDATKAREDEVRFRNEAEAYANTVLPRARGEGARIAQEAEAYRQEVIARAEGETARFLKLLSEYRKAPEVTRERLYIDTVESVMRRSSKVIVDTKSSGNLLYLPLDKLIQGEELPSPVQGSTLGGASASSVAPESEDPERRVRSDRGGRVVR
jgi:modulator of FtsH protease HflK